MTDHALIPSLRSIDDASGGTVCAGRYCLHSSHAVCLLGDDEHARCESVEAHLRAELSKSLEERTALGRRNAEQAETIGGLIALVRVNAWHAPGCAPAPRCTCWIAEALGCRAAELERAP